MKDEIKTIIIGISATLIAVFLAIFVMYKIDQRNNEDIKPSTNKNDVLKPNENKNNSNNKPNNNDSNNNKPDNNDTPVINDNKDNQENNDKETKNKVTVYLFHGSTCPACNNAIEVLTSRKATSYKNVDIKLFEIYNNKDNSMLMQKVAAKLNVEAKQIPFFVIGDYSKIGLNEEKILTSIENANKNNNYKDIVAEVIKENSNLNPVMTEIK